MPEFFSTPSWRADLHEFNPFWEAFCLGHSLAVSDPPLPGFPFRLLKAGEWVVLHGCRETGKSWWMRAAALDAFANGVPFLYVDLSGHYCNERWAEDPSRLLLLDDWELPYAVRRDDLPLLPMGARGVVAVSLPRHQTEWCLRQKWAWPFQPESSVTWVDCDDRPVPQADYPLLPAEWRVAQEGGMFRGYEFYAWPPLGPDEFRRTRT